MAVDGDDHVTVLRDARVAVEEPFGARAAQAGLVRGASGLDGDDDGPPFRAEAETPRSGRREVLRLDPEVGVVDVPVLDQLCHGAPGGVDGNREADALARARVAPDLGVDPD